MEIKKEEIDKWFNGDRSFNVTQKMRDALGEKQLDGYLRRRLKDHWDKGELEGETPNLKSTYEKVHYKILLEEKQERVSRTRRIGRWIQVAAALMIPIGLTFWLSVDSLFEDVADNKIEMISPEGARIHFALPDGSEGWLAGGSKLTYETSFKKNREVEVNGKAFFSVKHDPRHPFLVKMKDYQVQVLGTKFDVTNYDKDSICEVVVTNGRVQVDNSAGQFAEVLTRNQAIRINKNLKTAVRKQINARDYSAWIDGRLVFSNDPLTVVADKIRRHYGVDVELENKRLESQMFRAIVDIGNLEELMSYLTLTMPIDYKIELAAKQSDGKIGKRKLIIYERK